MNELPETNAAEARRWLDQAEEELLAARRLAGEADLPARIACFLAHLAAEKALKAYLISRAVPFPRVHDLADLRALLPASPDVGIFDTDLERLNPWAIEGRYPGDVAGATRSEANRCVDAAERVVGVVSVAIGDQDSQ